MEIAAFSFQATPKVFEPCQCEFLEGGGCTIDFNTKCERKSSRTRKENLSLWHTGAQEPRRHPGALKTMNIKFLNLLRQGGLPIFFLFFSFFKYILTGRKKTEVFTIADGSCF